MATNALIAYMSQGESTPLPISADGDVALDMGGYTSSAPLPPPPTPHYYVANHGTLFYRTVPVH